MAFDPKCLDLARHFLGNLATERICFGLAQHIQDEVESWCADEKARIEAEFARLGIAIQGKPQ